MLLKSIVLIDTSNNLNHVQQTDSGGGAHVGPAADVLRDLSPVPAAAPGDSAPLSCLAVQGEDFFIRGNSFSLDLVGRHP